jgi:GNAT superfamily N-acetyltransferase
VNKLMGSIRQATLTDSGLIAKMGAQTFRDAFGTMNDPENLEEYVKSNFSREQIASELADSNSIFLLSFENDRTIGYAKLKSGKVPGCVSGLNPIELVRIYVVNDAIGKGRGSALLKACLGEASKRGYATIWLGVWEHNESARGFL